MIPAISYQGIYQERGPWIDEWISSTALKMRFDYPNLELLFDVHLEVHDMQCYQSPHNPDYFIREWQPSAAVVEPHVVILKFGPGFLNKKKRQGKLMEVMERKLLKEREDEKMKYWFKERVENNCPEKEGKYGTRQPDEGGLKLEGEERLVSEEEERVQDAIFKVICLAALLSISYWIGCISPDWVYIPRFIDGFEA